VTIPHDVDPLDFREVMMLTDLITERHDVLDRSIKALAGEPVDGIEAQIAILKSIEGKVRPPRLAPFAGPSLTLRDSDARIPLRRAGD
jgi:hypothetical protein